MYIYILYSIFYLFFVFGSDFYYIVRFIECDGKFVNLYVILVLIIKFC